MIVLIDVCIGCSLYNIVTPVFGHIISFVCEVLQSDEFVEHYHTYEVTSSNSYL